MLITAIPLTQGNCAGSAAFSGKRFILLHSIYRALPAAPMAPGHWDSAASLPACPKEPSAHGALPKRLLSAVARRPRTPLLLSTRLGQEPQQGQQPLLTQQALTQPTWRSPGASTGRCWHLFPWGLMCPHSGMAREVREIQHGQ